MRFTLMIEELDPFVLIPTHRLTMSSTAYKRFREQVKLDGRILRPVASVEHLGENQDVADLLMGG